MNDLRRYDHLINYLYLPPIVASEFPESLALIYSAITVHHDYLEERRIAQLSEIAAVHLKYKLTADAVLVLAARKKSRMSPSARSWTNPGWAKVPSGEASDPRRIRRDRRTIGGWSPRSPQRPAAAPPVQPTQLHQLIKHPVQVHGGGSQVVASLPAPARRAKPVQVSLNRLRPSAPRSAPPPAPAAPGGAKAPAPPYRGPGWFDLLQNDRGDRI